MSKAGITFFDIIWHLEDEKLAIEKKYKRKNLSADGQCRLDDEWIYLSNMIDFLRMQQCKEHGWGTYLEQEKKALEKKASGDHE